MSKQSNALFHTISLNAEEESLIYNKMVKATLLCTIIASVYTQSIVGNNYINGNTNFLQKSNLNTIFGNSNKLALSNGNSIQGN
jgi:hypothetical protein